MKTKCNSIQRGCIGMMLIALLVLGLSACGPQAPETYTIGVVNFSLALDPVFEGFKLGMAEAGYVEGENTTYIYEGAVGSIDALDPAIQKLLAEDIDLILSISTPATQKVKAATADSGLPVVFGPLTDPIASDIVDSLISPGGNLTGVQNRGSMAKGLDWLLQIVPDVKTLYVPHNPQDNSSVQGLTELQTAADSMGLALQVVEISSGDELEAILGAVPDEIDAIYQLPSGFFSARSASFAAAGINHNLPVLSVAPQTSAGVLVSYGHEYVSLGEQLSRMAVQILQGADPGVLPVEIAQFYLSINLATAEAMGLEISDDILTQADEIVR